jgi:hypothetical protein
MRAPRSPVSPKAQERRVWELLVETFEWKAPPDHPVDIRTASGDLFSSARVQIFELVVTAILARIRPEFRWSVTPNRQDRGLDFLGVHRFLDDAELGIAAAITVGGQCKKRTTVNEVLEEIAGSIIQMADAINPNLIVVALSARLTRRRLEEAQGKFERQCRRHCHIFDRTQIEGLMAAHLEVVSEILSYGLPKSERDEVVAYLRTNATSTPQPTVEVDSPPRILAGSPFSIRVDVRWTLAASPDARVWWRPLADDPDRGIVSLIGPIGADSERGVNLMAAGASDDPFSTSCVLELTTYSVGDVDLGEMIIGLDSSDVSPAYHVSLGKVAVVESMRPRFFAQPYRPALARLEQDYEYVLAGSPRTVGVVGAGGSGKSRLCEEFALERRRRGCTVVTARHPKTHEAPLRILADLIAELAEAPPSVGGPAEDILRAIGRYDQVLATRATAAIRSLFGTRTTAAVGEAEQQLVSAILLLVVAHSRRAPLIVHLQDLHWCSVEVLSLLERTVQQISHLCGTSTAPATAGRVLFLLEGRSRESGESGDEVWSSAPFEAFLARLDGTVVTCSPFTPDDGLTFTRRLFEDRHNAHRLIPDDLLQLQDELVSRICKSAGGNPFHTLEQVRFLKELGVVRQNAKSGLLYMIRPAPSGVLLPDSVFDAIRARWTYIQARAPELALLVWGSALLDDQIPAPLFARLWSELAPTISVRDIDATDMLWTGDGASLEVVFRHENYFGSVRRFTVSAEHRRRVVQTYCDWFASLRRPSPAERFSWARAILELPDPDRVRARALLVSARNSSMRSGDPRLTRRIQAFYLDLIWELNTRTAIAMSVFLRHCDEERDLCRELLGVDRDQAATRIQRALRHLDHRVRTVGRTIPVKTRDRLLRRLLAAEALHAELLFNDRRPTESATIATRVADSVRARGFGSSEDRDWKLLEMEAMYILSCAQAISGEFSSAVRSSSDAAEIAMRVKSPLARKAVSTYGTMLLSENPKRGESVLRECLAKWSDDQSSDASLVHVHLCMALVLQAYPLKRRSAARRAMLDEAQDQMTRVHDVCRRLGLYPDAGAAALVRGVVSTLLAEDDAAAWFAQGVASAARGRQMETLWRSHINLAAALYQRERRISDTAHDHAVAALEIMQETLATYSEPESSPRFEMLSIGLAEAVWMLIATGDDTGVAILEQYPVLRSRFSDPEAGVLLAYDGGDRHFQWLRVADVDYVLY